ncbi:MAG: 1-acyl-sn-glycerol-3-phosphate acyltransferase [Proteobacteria bacterium]|nr:1-acyl-sn-glycerol-3-phosphate acyltransferase [Pseudomonadota bacterium]
MSPTPLIYARSLAFNIAFFCWAMLSAILFSPLFLISSRASLKAGHPWAMGSLWLVRIICGIKYEIRGRQYLREGSAIYASKHQSAWDTIIFLTLMRHPAYVLKRELLRIPLWGWYLWRMKMIAIDRSAGGAGLKDMLRQSKSALADGRNIVIFPEGTRIKVGAQSHYHPGIVAMYSQCKVPVVPVALNSGCFWGRNAFLKRPGKIVMEFLPPIPPGQPKDQFLTQLQHTIETATNRLVAEANAASRKNGQENR